MAANSPYRAISGFAARGVSAVVEYQQESDNGGTVRNWRDGGPRAAICAALAIAPACAENVPLPTPAPQPKTGDAPPAGQCRLRPAASRTVAARGISSRSRFIDKGSIGADDDRLRRQAARDCSTGSASICPACRPWSAISCRSGPTAAAPRARSTSRSPARCGSNTIRRRPIDIIADGSSVVVRDRNLATQDLYPLSQTPLRYLLADRIDLAARHRRRQRFRPTTRSSPW